MESGSEPGPATKKAATKKTATKKTAARKASTKKTTAKKSPAKKTAAKKASVTKLATPHEAASGRRTSARSALTAPTVRASKFFKKARKRAKKVIDDPKAMRKVAEEASRTANSRTGPFQAVLDDFRTLIRLVVAYSRGHYRKIPPDQLAIVVAGLIYVVSPIDLIPDFLPGGYVDDALVIGWVIKTVRAELDAFREWEEGVGS
jgi:uncharacterized membrane protein YkvA (DUF1232 family)